MIIRAANAMADLFTACSSQLTVLNPTFASNRDRDAFPYLTLTHVLGLQGSKRSTNKGSYSLFNIKNWHAHTFNRKNWTVNSESKQQKSFFPDRGLCIYSFCDQIRNHEFSLNFLL